MQLNNDLSSLEQERVGVTVVCREGIFVAMNEKCADLYGYDRDELIGTQYFDLLPISEDERIWSLGRLFDGKKHKGTFMIERGDGSLAEVTASSVKIKDVDTDDLSVDCEDSDLLKTEIIDFDIIEKNRDSVTKEVTAEAFEDISAEELRQIGQNTRVSGPDGTLPLNSIMLDTMVGHNEIEQYKKGAISLHEAIEQRLEEERQRNPGSDTEKVLQEISESVRGLYLRIQRGDEELHGNRDGKFSGYWN